jgi:hypothetical protein
MNSAISVFAAHAHDRAGNLDLDRAVATTVQLHEHSCAIRSSVEILGGCGAAPIGPTVCLVLARGMRTQHLSIFATFCRESQPTPFPV